MTIEHPADRADRWREHYVRDDNTRWIPRDQYEARQEFPEAIEIHDKPNIIRSIITRFFRGVKL